MLWALLAFVILIFIAGAIFLTVWLSWTSFFVPVYKRYKFNIEKAAAEKDLYSIEVKKAKLIEMSHELEEQYKELSMDTHKLKAEKSKLEKEMAEDKILFQELKLKKQEKELDESKKALEKESKKDKAK
jgi:chromosome segregation ATPase